VTEADYRYPLWTINGRTTPFILMISVQVNAYLIVLACSVNRFDRLKTVCPVTLLVHCILHVRSRAAVSRAIEQHYKTEKKSC
jgi:hypothetical protein